MRILKQKFVKTRKIQVCYDCGRQFEVGTEMERQVNIHDGRINAVYSCKTCNELINKFSHLFIDDDEGFFPYLCVSEYIANTRYNGLTPEALLFALTPKSHPTPDDIDFIIREVEKHQLASEKIKMLYQKLQIVIYDNQEKHNYDCWGSGVGGGRCDFSIAVPKNDPIPEYLVDLFYNKIPHEFDVSCRRSNIPSDNKEDSYNFEMQLKKQHK